VNLFDELAKTVRFARWFFIAVVVLIFAVPLVSGVLRGLRDGTPPTRVTAPPAVHVPPTPHAGHKP
jgi:hypothetical protein